VSRTRELLIAVDVDDRTTDAIALGTTLADALDAHPVLVHVFTYDPWAQDPYGPAETQTQQALSELLVDLAREAGAPQDTEARVVPGTSVPRALQRLSEQESTLALVVGSTHRGRLGRVLPGSVGERLLAGSASPVAIAPRGYSNRAARALTRIGVGFDGSPEAARALDGAVRLARGSGAALEVIAVHTPVAFGALAASGGAPVDIVSINTAAKAELSKELDEAVAHLPDGITAVRRLDTGDAAQVLADASIRLDLLVTGSRGYGPLSAVLAGSTTHALLRDAQCPLLITPRRAQTNLPDSPETEPAS
jgi:nucleotide-binding universal stress UspA family protein